MEHLHHEFLQTRARDYCVRTTAWNAHGSLVRVGPRWKPPAPPRDWLGEWQPLIHTAAPSDKRTVEWAALGRPQRRDAGWKPSLSSQAASTYMVFSESQHFRNEECVVVATLGWRGQVARQSRKHRATVAAQHTCTCSQRHFLAW